MERINFKQQRDFGEILGTTFTFVRKNILQLAKFTLVFSAIPLLAGQLLFGQAFSHVFSSGFFLDPGSNPLADSMGQLIIAYVLMVGGILTYYVTVNSYIALYAAGVENISISTVGKEVLRKLPRYFGAAIITTVMIMIAALLFIIPGIYMFVVMIPVFIVMSVENVGVFKAISRVFYIIKNAWWATFGLYIVIYLIEVFIAMVFYIPTYVIQWLTLIIPFRRGAETYNETGQAIEGITTAWQWTAIYMPLYFFGVLLATSLIVVAVALKYFSLVEQKEGGGELEKISQIGT